MTSAMFAATVSEIGGWLIILAVTVVFTLVSSRRAKVSRDRAKREVQQ